MRNIFLIAKKELSIYFTTVIGYTGFGAYAFLMGLVFVTTVNKYQQFTQFYVAQQQPSLLERLNFNDVIITPMLSTGLWMFLFFVPFLTMRLFAEEKQSRTFELLMTTPITSLQMVLGKFLGVGAMILSLTAIPLVFPVILHVYGTSSGPGSPVEWLPVLSGTLTVLMLGLVFCAMGLLISSLTESQIVAAVMTFAALLLAFVLPMIASRIEGDWRTAIEYLSPMSHVQRGLQGRVLLADLVYFGSSIFILLFMTLRVVESHRWR
ncbi:MAG: ABC transporter permease [Deltaproteobacteria bacterium]|jgi:ABC-2 type transport system permease protein